MHNIWSPAVCRVRIESNDALFLFQVGRAVTRRLVIYSASEPSWALEIQLCYNMLQHSRWINESHYFQLSFYPLVFMDVCGLYTFPLFFFTSKLVWNCTCRCNTPPKTLAKTSREDLKHWALMGSFCLISPYLTMYFTLIFWWYYIYIYIRYIFCILLPFFTIYFAYINAIS